MNENTIKEKLVVGLYARVSTSRQEQEATIESQLDEIKRRISEDGNILPSTNIFFDEGWSGELIARPSLGLMKDVKKRRISYQKQLAEITNKSAQINIEIDVDDLTKEAIKVVKNLDFSDKFRVIRDIIDKITVTERSGAEICAHLPLPVTITEKLGYEPQCRNSRAT